MAVCFGGARNNSHFFASAPDSHIADESQIDEALQQAATDALGPREGTIIVMDPQTGRVRAVVNPEIAFESSFAPGSTIKPFTALAALRAGLINKDSRTLCRGEYSRDGFEIACAHPKDLPPFNPAEALAYSCNYYFGTLGERLAEASLGETLASFGFGKQTGVNTDREAAGKLMRGLRDPRNALGEGGYLQTTPIQLITAYSALVNGGRLLEPRVASAQDFRTQSRGQVEIAADQRALIIEGMRGAVRYGTAEHANLQSLPLDIFGKTGTSAPNRGFRSQGWFVGFASDPAAQVAASPESVELAVLVFLYKGHGAQAAEVSRSIFEEFARARQGDGGTGRRGDTATVRSNHPVTPSPPLPVSPSAVRVHRVRENITEEISLEDYVLGVVAAEGSTESEPEALKALAIAARTYALKNLGRHTSDGYDFCTTTHCQTYISVGGSPTPGSPAGQPGWGGTVREGVSPSINALPYGRASAAVRATSDQVLRDEKGQLADSYFSASCGGATANMRTLWGVNAPSYLRGVRDQYCATMPHHSWTDAISSAQLLQALHSDARTDPGERLSDVVVARRDATGRAESITIEGNHRRTVSGWDFKIIVGRALGWNFLKSSRFEIARSGSNFIFRGSGFGHGLGLCQEGAHVMAQRGAGYQQILAKYFPGTSVARGMGRRGDGETGRKMTNQIGGWQDDLLLLNLDRDRPVFTSPRRPVAPSPYHSVSRAMLSSEHFRVSYPARVQGRDAEGVLETLESARADLLRRVSAAGILMNQLPPLEIFINDTTGDFVGRTGQPWWAGAATKGNRIELQPLDVLKRRGVLETTLRHEMVHVVIDAISRGRGPRWLAEGMALYFAGEGPMISRYEPQSRMTVEEIEQKLSKASSAQEMRIAYAAAYREVNKIIKKDGEASLWRRLAES